MEKDEIIAKANNNVLRLERDELAYSYEYYSYPKSCSLENIGVLSIEYDLPVLKEEGYSFSPEYVKPMEGDTYIRDPFHSKHFIRIENFAEEVIKSKQNCILRIAALLGAKDVELSVNVVRSEARKLKGDISIRKTVTQAQVKADRENAMKMAQKYSTKSHFETDITEDGYLKAEALAKDYGLYNETDVSTLLSWFSPDNNVRLTSHEIHFSMSNELNDSLDIAVGLTAMDGVFNISSSFSRSVETKSIIEGTMKLLF